MDNEDKITITITTDALRCNNCWEKCECVYVFDRENFWYGPLRARVDIQFCEKCSEMVRINEKGEFVYTSFPDFNQPQAPIKGKKVTPVWLKKCSDELAKNKNKEE